MIERKRIDDFLSHLGRAEMLNARSPRLTRDEAVELCRVYLAWMEAPEELVGERWDGYGEIYPDKSMVGKRVRLVEVKE